MDAAVAIVLACTALKVPRAVDSLLQPRPPPHPQLPPPPAAPRACSPKSACPAGAADAHLPVYRL